MVQVSSKATSNLNRKNSRKSSLSQSVDHAEHESAEHQQNEMTQKSSTLTFSLGKFARLKFNDNQEILFNINCQIRHLIDYFIAKCKLETFTTTNSVPEINSTQTKIQPQSYHPANLDLADKNGIVKNLREKRLDHTAYASELLEPRETYVLVYVQPSELKNQVKIEPLLKNCELLTPSFIKNLQPKLSKALASTSKQNKQSNTSNNTRNSVSNNTLLSKNEQKALHDTYSKSQSQTHHNQPNQSSTARSQTPTKQGKGSKERT